MACAPRHKLDADVRQSNPRSSQQESRFVMTCEQILDVIKLLSALEAWSFTNQHAIPDYLLVDLDKSVGMLSTELLRTDRT